VTEDNRMPNFWWCPTHHLYRGGEERPCADAVQLVPAPPAPRVFFPGDTVPAGRTVQNVFGETVLLVDDIDCASATVVEIPVLTSEEWQAAVRRARAEREQS